MADDVKGIVSKISVAGISKDILFKEDYIDPECELYKSIKTRIFANLNGHLFKEIESIRNLESENSESVISVSFRKLLSLPEMESVVSSLKEELNGALESSFLASPFTNSSAESLRSGRSRCNRGPNSWSLDSSSSDYELNMLPEKFDTIGGKSNIEFILLKLVRASLSEIFETSSWENLKVIVRKSLSDDSSSVFHLALRLHARFLLSSSNVATLESFTSLKTSLLEQCATSVGEIELPNVSEGIALSSLSHIRRLRITNLIITVFRDLSKNYIRLPATVIEDLVGGMIEIVTFCPEESHFISPLHLLSVVDPKALWLKVCFYYSRIRNILFKRLSEKQNLLLLIFKGVISWLNRVNVKSKRTSINDDLDQIIGKIHVQFALFSHSLHAYSYFMNCDIGKNFLWNFDGGATYQDLLRCIISYLNYSSSCPTAFLLLKILKKLLSNVRYSALTSNFVQVVILNPLISAHQSLRVDCETDSVYRGFVIELLQTLLKTKTGRDKFIFMKFNIDSSNVSPAKILLLYATNLMKNFSKVDHDLLQKVLITCVSMSSSPKGLTEFEDSDLISMFGIYYRLLNGGECNSIVQSFSSYSLNASESSKLELLNSCLISFIAYSGGVWLIEKEGILLPVLNKIFNQPAIPWNQLWFKKLLLSSSMMDSGYKALVGANLLGFSLNNLWKQNVDNEDFLKKGEENLELEISKIFSLCSTLRGVKATLVEQEGSEVTLTEESIYPSSIQEVLELTLKINRDSSGNVILKDDLSDYIDSNEAFLGFRIIRFIMSSLDVTLLLQHKFFVQEHIMMICNRFVLEEKGELIFDEVTLICEQILRNSFLVEFGCEKIHLAKNMAMRSQGIMPSRISMLSLTSHMDQYSDWIVNNYSYHRSHSRQTPRRLKNDMIKFLGSTRHGLRDINWLNQLRKVYRSIFIGSSSPELKNNVLIELLEEVQKAYTNINGNTRSLKLQWSENIHHSLFPEDLLGIKLAIRFGTKLNLVQPTPLVHSNLAQFIRATYGALKILRDEFLGFDWFLASVFLLCCGNVDRCLHFINNFVKTNSAPFVWAAFGELLSKLKTSSNSNQNDYIFVLIQQVELILSLEVPKVYAAFQSSVASVGVLVHQWISQSFLNILEWSEIKNFWCLTILNEADYVVYFCVALFLHLEPLILHTVATYPANLLEQLKINPVCHFHLGNYLYFIEKIHKIHHNSVIRSILKCTADLNKYL